LSALLAREAPLDPERTWSIIGQAASALAAAHDAGLVHRDIKPGNLLLCPDGMLKVTDFGIARATGASAVTTVGNVLGTPHYISPEQVAGEPVSAATDFYALGVVGYECLTGKRLYDGEPMAVLLAHRDQQPPALPAGIPAGLRDLVTALLDKDPAKRPTDGRAIAAQAERFNAPTVSMPALADAYPSAPTRATTAAPAVAVVDEEPKTSAFRLPEGVRSRRDTLLPIALLVVVLVIAAVLIGVVLKAGPSSSGHKSAASGQASSTPVRVASVQPFTGGSGSPDHPEEASLATDGNTSTAWYTQHYATSDFGSLRSGTGLVFDLGSPVAVKTLALRLAVPGVSVAVHAGNDQAGLLTSTVVGGASAAGSSLTLHPTTTARYWLVWFTRLASNDGGYRAGIAEASFRR
jgi:serine/threonine protein kinase